MCKDTHHARSLFVPLSVDLSLLVAFEMNVACFFLFYFVDFTDSDEKSKQTNG